MAQPGQRKGFTKLTRKPYDFKKKEPEPDTSNLLLLVRTCDCDAPASQQITGPSLDPLEGEEGELDPIETPEDCVVDVYDWCGATGAMDQERFGSFYMRVREGSENPGVVFVPSAGSNGACFSKTGQVACTEATGSAMPEFIPATACDEDPCVTPPPGDQWMRMELCENDPSYDNPMFTPRTIYVHISVFTTPSVPKVVKYNQHCYESVDINALISEEDIPVDGFRPPPENVEEKTACDSEECECCDNVMETLNKINAALQERLLFTRAGVLPIEWKNSAYILYGEVETANGCTTWTDCYTRAETWRLWLKECDGWIAGLFAFGFLEFTALDGVAPGAHTDYDAADYNDGISSYIWFLDAFGTTADGELFTMGNIGSYGAVNEELFGDTDKHVLIQTEEFCDLVNDTSDTMLALCQLLQATAVLGAWADAEHRHTYSGVNAGGDPEWSDSVDCAINHHADTPYQIKVDYASDYTVSPAVVCEFNGSAADPAVGNEAPSVLVGWADANIDVENTRSRIFVDVSAFSLIGLGVGYASVAAAHDTSPPIPADGLLHNIGPVDADGGGQFWGDKVPARPTGGPPFVRQEDWAFENPWVVLWGDFVY